MIYLLTAIGLSPGCRSTVHIYTQTIHRNDTKQIIHRTTKQLEECGPCPVLASYTLAFMLCDFKVIDQRCAVDHIYIYTVIKMRNINGLIKLVDFSQTQSVFD